MGIWDRVKAAFAPKKKRTPMPVAVPRYEMAPARPGGEALLGTYRENPWMRALVEKVADGVAGVNWRVYRAQDESGAPRKNISHARAAWAIRHRDTPTAVRQRRLVEVTDHALLELLADPNPKLTGRALLKLLVIHLKLIGEAFLAMQKVGPYVVQLWPIPPTAVMQLPRESDPPEQRGYRVVFGRFTGYLPAADVLHLRNPDPADPAGRGSGVGFSLGDEIDSDEYAAVFMKTFLHNFGVPPAVIGIDGMRPEDKDNPNIKRFIEHLNRDHKGPENAGKVLILPGKTTISPVTSSLKEMELTRFREFEHRFQRQVMGIPPEIVGDTTTSNVASSRAAKEIFAEQVLTPEAEFIRTELQIRLVPLVDPDAILDYDSLIPADRDHELRVAAVAPWSRSVNEWRELQGLEPLPQFEGVFPPLAMPGQQVGDAEPHAETEQERPTGEEKVDEAAKGDPPWALVLAQGARKNR